VNLVLRAHRPSAQGGDCEIRVTRVVASVAAAETLAQAATDTALSAPTAITSVSDDTIWRISHQPDPQN
jgi:hypothetical protein